VRRAVGVVAVVVLLGGCVSSTDGAGPTGSGDESPVATPTADQPVTLLALGDSWPYGAHCNGCRPFPELYADGLEHVLGRDVRFLDLVTNGGTSASLRQALTGDVNYRRAVSEADVVMISTGANDMEPAGQAWKAGTCGGSDGLECFRALAHGWEQNFGAMLEEIDDLRSGKPTAVRLVTNANEFLSDPGLVEYFGPDFGSTGGAAITAMHHDALCAAAAEHDATCVDLRPVLNGPNHDIPRDVNTQEAMQAVADALVASGTAELHAP
jgi:lysophospholipase L1-like esterase